MQKEGLKRFLIVLGILFVGFVYVGSANAQTSTTAGTICPSTTPIWCPVKNMCVATAADCTSVSNTATATPACSSSQRWCSSKNMCVDESTPCDGSCGGSKYFCSYQDNSGNGWCSTSPCTQTQCEGSGKKWCKNSTNTCGTASSGWCTSSSSENCPPYDRASCDAVKGEWCGNWCAQNGATCPAMSWPSDQTECEIYKGTWCPPVQSTTGATSCVMGSCMMAGQNCSDMQKTMSCWDGSSSASSCPAMPTTKETCTANAGKGVYWCENTSGGWSSGWCSRMPCSKSQCVSAGKNWCESSATASATAATSGWCSDMKCMPMPPAGKMTCPDGETFVDRLKDCPRKGMETHKTCPDGTKVPIASTCPEQKKTCADGSTVSADGVCPTFVMCPSGAKVSTLADCPAIDYKECSNGKKVLKNTECLTEEKKKFCPDGKTEVTAGKDCPFSEKELAALKERKESYLKKLNELHVFFENAGDTTLVNKVLALESSLHALPLTSAGQEILDTAKIDINLLLEEKDTIEKKKKVDEDQKRDEENRVKALQNMKNAIKGFSRQVQKALTVVREIESKEIKISNIGKGNKIILVKTNIVVPAELKDLLNSMNSSVDTILNAQTYDEASEAIEGLRADIENIQSYEMYIRALPDLPNIIQKIHSYIVAEDKEIALLKNQLKNDDKKELGDMLQEIENMMSEVKENAAKLRQGEVTDEDIDDFADEFIYGKLSAVDDSIKDMRQIRRFVGFTKDANGKFARYSKELNKKNSKLKGDIKEQAMALTQELSCFVQSKAVMPDICREIKETLNLSVIDLNKLTKEKKDQFKEKVFPVIDAVSDRLAQLDELLGLAKKSALGREIDTMREKLDKLKSFELPTLEGSIDKVEARANFYRGDPRAEFARIINGKSVSYSKFAQNE